MRVAWNQFNIFSASLLGQPFVVCRNWDKNVGLDLTLWHSYSIHFQYCTVMQLIVHGVVLIMTHKDSHSFDLFMRWTFFIQFNFTEHEVLLREGEKWGETKQMVLCIHERGRGEKRQGFTRTSKTLLLVFFHLSQFFKVNPWPPFG